MEEMVVGSNFMSIINEYNTSIDDKYLSIECDLTFAILIMKILEPTIKFITVNEYKDKYKNRLHSQMSNLLSDGTIYTSSRGKYNVKDNWAGYITFEGIDDNENKLNNFMGPSPEKLRFYFQTKFHNYISSYISKYPFEDKKYIGNKDFFREKLQLIFKKLSSHDDIVTLLNSIKDILINKLYVYN